MTQDVPSLELLAAATPRPWFVVGPPWNVAEPWICTSDDPHAGHFVADLYGGPETSTAAFADSLEDRDLVADAELIVRAVNEYEALLTVEASLRAVVDFLGGPYGQHARDALAKLDEVRHG